MFKQKTILEVKAGERLHRFECEPDSPLGEVFDALMVMKSFVLEKINALDKQPEPCSNEKKDCCAEVKPEEVE